MWNTPKVVELSMNGELDRADVLEIIKKYSALKAKYLTGQKKIWVRDSVNKVKRYYIIDNNGKSIQVSTKKALKMLETEEAKEVQPFWK